MRGDIFCANLNNGIGAEQRGYRPVLIIQNNTGNKFSPTVIVAVITGQIHHKHSKEADASILSTSSNLDKTLLKISANSSESSRSPKMSLCK